MNYTDFETEVIVEDPDIIGTTVEIAEDGSVEIVEHTAEPELVTASETIVADNSTELVAINDTLTSIDYRLSALLFFIVFEWVYQKIHNFVKKAVKPNE